MRNLAGRLIVFLENKMIDFRKILIRYIALIGQCEGTDFLSATYPTAHVLGITPEEFTALMAAAREANENPL